MPHRITVTPAAARDLENQATYFAREAGQGVAIRFLDAAASSFGQLAAAPGMGRLWTTARMGHARIRVWRVMGFQKHLIFYQAGGDTLLIIRVIHAARDIDAAFEDEDGHPSFSG